MNRFLLVHYGEIGLKGSNKDYFVNKLRTFLKLKLEQRFRQNFVIKHSLGRLITKLPDDFVEDEYVALLSKVFGVKNFKFCFEGEVDIKGISDQIWDNFPKDFIHAEKLETFRVTCKRSMSLPFKSTEAEREIGSLILSNGLDMRVNLKNPELTVDVEFFNDHGYFSFVKYQGVGGFPPNSQSKLVSLLSSGFDSPVAAYLMMKRGARVIFVHFHGYPYTDKDEMEQVKDLVKILSDFQLDTKLYLIPFGHVQRSIATNVGVPARIRTVLYRRMMLRIAEEVAHKEQAKGLVTGDSYGQVASQTPENIFAIHDASKIPLLQPLISFDKEDIIKIAEKIGTSEISALPCKDTCTMFTPKTPEIKAKISELRQCESLLDIDGFVKSSLEKSELVNF